MIFLPKLQVYLEQELVLKKTDEKSTYFVNIISKDGNILLSSLISGERARALLQAGKEKGEGV